MRATLLILCCCCLASAQSWENIQVEKISGGYQFTEGPAWAPSGFLLFSDIPANRILKIGPDGKQIFRENSGGANGNAFDEKGRLYTAEGGTRRVTRTAADGKVEVLAESFEGKKFNAPNDICVRKDGNVYFTDPAYGKATETREMDYYGVFRITPKGELELVARYDKRPNGIALSPNGRILYVNGADERVVRAFDLDRNGKASGERILIAGIEGVPDGLKTDEKGNLWIAAAKVHIYSPEGKLLNSIEVPETPANLAFDEGDRKNVYVTARTSLYRIRLDAKVPEK